MNGIIITVAGLSSRFNKDLDRQCLKCLYNENEPKNSILSLIINTVGEYDQYIIVGGYKFDELKEFVDENYPGLKGKIKIVYNDKYAEYGSGYSLYMGILAIDKNINNLTFVEGDLVFDRNSFDQVKNYNGSVITVSKDFVVADKSVALYMDVNNKPHYIYDTSHKSIYIAEPFIGIYNSAQIWRFSDVNLLQNICNKLTELEKAGTNLVIIQKYFTSYNNHIEIILIKRWYNCNTLYDYKKAINKLKK